MTTDFCPSPRGGENGAEEQRPHCWFIQGPLRPKSMHTGQPSGPGGLSAHAFAASLSFPLCFFAHTLSAGSEFMLFKSLKQAPLLQNARTHTPHPSSDLCLSLRQSWFSVYTWLIYYRVLLLSPLPSSLPVGFCLSSVPPLCLQGAVHTKGGPAWLEHLVLVGKPFLRNDCLLLTTPRPPLQRPSTDTWYHI